MSDADYRKKQERFRFGGVVRWLNGKGACRQTQQPLIDQHCMVEGENQLLQVLL